MGLLNKSRITDQQLKENDSFDIVYLNICGFLNNKEQLLVLIRDKNPYIIFLSETRVTENIYDQEIEIKGYNTVRCNSHTRFTGGVLIYIKKRIEYEIISNIHSQGNWFLLIKTLKGFRSGNFAVIYHSPSSKVMLHF